MPSSTIEWLLVSFAFGYMLAMPSIAGGILNKLSKTRVSAAKFQLANVISFASYIIAFAMLTPFIFVQAKRADAFGIAVNIAFLVGGAVGFTIVITTLGGLKKACKDCLR